MGAPSIETRGQKKGSKAAGSQSGKEEEGKGGRDVQYVREE